MRETSYTMKKAYAENGTPLALTYSVLVSDGDNELKHYGVKIVEENSGSHAQALDLTTDAEQIHSLLDKLSRNTVTPAGLMDILADWL